MVRNPRSLTLTAVGFILICSAPVLSAGICSGQDVDNSQTLTNSRVQEELSGTQSILILEQGTCACGIDLYLGRIDGKDVIARILDSEGRSARNSEPCLHASFLAAIPHGRRLDPADGLRMRQCLSSLPSPRSRM
jgi:hypothetical protein